jgi:hypothetical protein
MSFIEEKSIDEKLRENIVLSIDIVWDYKIDPSLIKIEKTKGDWDIAVILYPLVKLLKLPLDEFGPILGDCILFYMPEIYKYEIVKGFLNLKISDTYLISKLFYIQDFCKELERRSKENIYTPKKDES